MAINYLFYLKFLINCPWFRQRQINDKIIDQVENRFFKNTNELIKKRRRPQELIKEHKKRRSGASEPKSK